MQAHSFFLGGIPMLFYGDEVAYTNDYSYQADPGKNYDNRWMHRPVIDWKKNELRNIEATVEHRVFSSTKKLLSIRRKLELLGDYKNLTWLTPHNIHVAGYVRTFENQRLFCVFNFSREASFLTWFAFKQYGNIPSKMYDHWSDKEITMGPDNEYLIIEPYSFYLLQAE
jgi:amylosucrase